ncbi:hypothetical protein KX935_03680 [Streptobacillus moniliformis]|uniref:hypothetical protein n=1 Tax=Streptobacillus moniliformis TaxID=34105 RepID=UPI0007E3AB83|nr:hypothetical protein [Streptobacillus moniliformis]QXW66318.1 hypothetical protein KX935_03680 [Streptobacillus moniliformis]
MGYEEYCLWKRKNILKIINNEIDVFVYDVEKNIDEINKFLQKEKTIDELREYENRLEKEEKKIFYQEENIINQFSEFIKELKEDTKDEYEAIKKELKEFFDSNPEYSDLEFNEGVIQQIIFEEKVLENKTENIVDIYQIPINYRGKIFEIDYEKKEIRKIS